MNHLYIGIIDQPDECLVSNTEEGLRRQIDTSLSKKNIAPLTEGEWAECVKGDFNREANVDCRPIGVIGYYKIESHLSE